MSILYVYGGAVVVFAVYALGWYMGAKARERSFYKYNKR